MFRICFGDLSTSDLILLVLNFDFVIPPRTFLIVLSKFKLYRFTTHSCCAYLIPHSFHFNFNTIALNCKIAWFGTRFQHYLVSNMSGRNQGPLQDIYLPGNYYKQAINKKECPLREFLWWWCSNLEQPFWHCGVGMKTEELLVKCFLINWLWLWLNQKRHKWMD